MAGRKIELEQTDTSLPLLAAQVLTQAGADDELMTKIRTVLLKRLERDEEKEEKAIERKRKIAYQNAMAVKQEMEERKIKQDQCSHLKQDGKSTRLRGQVVTGDREGRGKALVLVCGFCGKSYHYPPGPDQEAPPQHLLPPADEIGNWGL